MVLNLFESKFYACSNDSQFKKLSLHFGYAFIDMDGIMGVCVCSKCVYRLFRNMFSGA